MGLIRRFLTGPYESDSNLKPGIVDRGDLPTLVKRDGTEVALEDLGGGGGATVYAQVSRSVDISAWDGNAIPFDTVDHDPDGLWDAVNHQFVAAVAGFYAVRLWATTNSGLVDYVASGAGSNALNAVVNGAGANVDLVVSTPVAGAVYFPALVGVVELGIGDGLEIDGGGGASWTVHHGTTFSIQLIAAT